MRESSLSRLKLSQMSSRSLQSLQLQQFTQDMIAVRQKSSPDMGGQSQQSSVKGDEQEVVPLFRLEIFSQIQRYLMTEGRHLAEVPQKKQRINLGIILKGKIALM